MIDDVLRRHEDELRRALSAHGGGSRIETMASAIRLGRVAGDGGNGSYQIEVLGDAGGVAETIPRARLWGSGGVSPGDLVLVLYFPASPIPMIFAGVGGGGETYIRTVIAGYLGIVSE